MNEITIKLDSSNVSNISYSIYYLDLIAGSFSVMVSDMNHLSDIFIERKFRRRGIGKYILDLFKINKLHCTTWNESGISFYESLGFKKNRSTSDIYLITFDKEIHV